MTNICITELDIKINKDKYVPANQALRKVEHFIIKKIDETFPVTDFRAWLNSSSDKDFTWNKKRYTW